LWIVGENGFQWFGVGVVRYHLSEAPLPAYLSELHKSLNRSGHLGQFASVALENAEDPFDRVAS
jgi:hypothetical protein